MEAYFILLYHSSPDFQTPSCSLPLILSLYNIHVLLFMSIMYHSSPRLQSPSCNLPLILSLRTHVLLFMSMMHHSSPRLQSPNCSLPLIPSLRIHVMLFTSFCILECRPHIAFVSYRLQPVLSCGVRFLI